ncbi:MAG: hypothetical protein JKY82_02470 [Rhizobiaceae bacterium]|nr:hypothetical protein [Rhizobiaceae bacterium]MBL4731450.1 hypothetical protein [Rhizobiaceae bacterium]
MSCLRLIFASVALFVLASVPGAFSAELFDSTPIAQQVNAVSGINFSTSLEGGVVDGKSNHMFIGSFTIPLGSSFGTQVDLGVGSYDSDYSSAAAGLHIFWRDPGIGMFGIYGDYTYINPEHNGRVGFEGSLYHERFTVDVLIAARFGQHVYTTWFDEIDLAYYFTDNFRASIGHRGTSRGNVANISFEALNPNSSGWSVYGDAEIGEDDYSAAHFGVRYAFGSGADSSLIQRDRSSSVQIRIPRGLADISQCGAIASPKPKTWWRSRLWALCASKDELAAEGATIEKF